MEDPALAKGLVKRDIIRVVTPGTVTESSMLDESRNNYFACVYGAGGRFGLSFCDVSTGAFYATVAEGEQAVDRIEDMAGNLSDRQAVAASLHQNLYDESVVFHVIGLCCL